MIGGIDFFVKPDDDEKFKDIPPGHAVADGSKMYVRESEWPKLLESLRKVSKEKP